MLMVLRGLMTSYSAGSEVCVANSVGKHCIQDGFLNTLYIQCYAMCRTCQRALMHL